MRTQYRDYTQSFINIDKLCEVLSTVQDDKGIEKTFELKDEYKKVESESNNDKKVETKKEKKPDDDYSEFGPYGALLGYTGEDYDDDDEDFYICDMCDALGAKQKYDSAICDACHVCASCNEYINDDCSGCSYSIHRDGCYYRDKVPESEIISSDDLTLFKDATENRYCTKMKKKGFSILY